MNKQKPTEPTKEQLEALKKLPEAHTVPDDPDWPSARRVIRSTLLAAFAMAAVGVGMGVYHYPENAKAKVTNAVVTFTKWNLGR